MSSVQKMLWLIMKLVELISGNVTTTTIPSNITNINIPGDRPARILAEKMAKKKVKGIIFDFYIGVEL